MRKSTRRVLLGAATLAAISGIAHDAYAAKDNLTINAKIIAAVKITATQALDFGSLTETTGGTVKVDKAGAATVTGSVNTVGATTKQGQFKISAAKAAKLQVTLPATAKIAAGTKTMVVKSFLISSAKALGATPYKITFGATVTKKTDNNVGATLVVGAGQATGAYTGAAVMTGIYQ